MEKTDDGGGQGQAGGGGEGGGEVTLNVPTLLSLNNKSSGSKSSSSSKAKSRRSGSSGAVLVAEKRKRTKSTSTKSTSEGREGGGEEDIISTASDKDKDKRGRSPRGKSGGASQAPLLASFPSTSKGSGDRLAVPPLVQRRKRTVSTDVARMEGAGSGGGHSEEQEGDTRSHENRVHRTQDDSAIDTRSKEMASPRSVRPLTSRGGRRDDTADSSSDTESLDDLSRVSSDLEDMNIYLPPSFTDLSLAERVTVKVVHMLYNPRSGNKTGEKVMRKARKLFEDKYGKTVQVTKLLYKGHAEELCETMKLDGIDILCSVGGDGTFHECTNGMMKRMLADGAARVPPMALIAAGTGNSFMHELGCAKLKDAVHHICRGVHVPIDIAKLTFGDSTTCYAFNSLHWGMASKVAVTAEKLRWMGSAIRYTTAALIEMMKGSTARARITITDGDDNVITYDEDFALAIANNIITAGKGMKMAPTAKLDDGLIDLLLITTASTLDMMTIFRKVYDGTHTKLPHVRYIKVKSFSIVPYRTIEEKREKEKPSKSSSKPSSLEQLSDSPSSKKRVDKDKDKDTIERPGTGSSSSMMATIEEKGHEMTASGGGGGSGSGSGSQSNIEEIEELLDVDGELKGCTPFTCDIIPRALRVIL